MKTIALLVLTAAVYAVIPSAWVLLPLALVASGKLIGIATAAALKGVANAEWKEYNKNR